MKITMWTIMDKNKKAIACGSPRNRSMRLVESLDTNKVRIILYGTKGRAVSAFSGNLGFYDETDGYIKTNYPDPDRSWSHLPYEQICTPVKVILEIDD